MGTSTRITNKKINNILKKNHIGSNGDGIDKIISESLFPKSGKSRLKNSIINSTCTNSFINTFQNIINSSQYLNTNSNYDFNIFNFNNLSTLEKVESITDNLCFDEDPIIKQTIMNILMNENSPIEYFKNTYKVLKDLLAEYYTEQFEKILFEELASSTINMDDEECKTRIKGLVIEELNKTFSYNDYQIIIEKKEDKSFLEKTFRNYGNIILRGLKI